MKLLHVTDLHFRAQWFEWVASQAGTYDAVCISGDLLDIFGLKAIGIREQVRWVRAWIRAFPGKLFICSGNHDWWNPIHGIIDVDAHAGWLRKMSTLTVAVDGSRRIENDRQFVCLPWIGIPDGLDSSRQVILLAHCPPSGTDVACVNGRDNGDSRLAGALVDYSALVLCGHIHAPMRWYGRCGRSLYINPGCDFEQSQPNHVMIDLAQNCASYVAGSRPPEMIKLF